MLNYLQAILEDIIKDVFLSGWYEFEQFSFESGWLIGEFFSQKLPHRGEIICFIAGKEVIGSFLSIFHEGDDFLSE